MEGRGCALWWAVDELHLIIPHCTTGLCLIRVSKLHELAKLFLQ